MPGRAWFALGAGLALLAGCGRPDGGAAPRPDDRTDPALTSALDDPILVDPTLSQSSNLTQVRTTETPGDAFYPPGSAPARPQACGGALVPGSAWAAQLPPAFAVPGGARLREAAGKTGQGCAVRVAQFEIGSPPAAVLDGYWQRVVRGGFSATQLGRGDDQVLYGAKGGTSYVLVVRPAAGGSDVGLVVREAG